MTPTPVSPASPSYTDRPPPSTPPAESTSWPTAGIRSAFTRRNFLRGGTLGVAALALPVRWFDRADAAAPAANGVFGYGVASGDPLSDRVIIWTRATPPGKPIAFPGSGLGDPLLVTWELARDPSFRHVARRGTVRTSPESDHTVKVDITGLCSYTRYWYRFRAAGQTSAVGATRTAGNDPDAVHALRFALMSCSNYAEGYFGPYRGLAARDDLDFVLHVGDYLYEYGSEHYVDVSARDRRHMQPPVEITDLAGYRLRHAMHKADPDLQAVHRAHPFITIFDDHEIANNAWRRGAQNHTPGAEGGFVTRRAQALQAYLEWMPLRLPDQHAYAHRGTRFFRSFEFGDLAELSVLDTRQNRAKQVDVAGYSTSGGGFVPTGEREVDARLRDPERHLPEPDQMRWLQERLSRPRRWHLLGNQTVLSPLRFPGSAWGHPGKTLLNSDQWDGYQADQAALISHLAGRTAGDAVVLTGDIHSSWAIDIPGSTRSTHYPSAGVEFVCPSVTSDGFYEQLHRASSSSVEDAIKQTTDLTDHVRRMNPWVKYLDGTGHGYTIVDVTPDRVHGDWYLTPTPTSARPDPRADHSVVPGYATSWQTIAGTRRVGPAAGPVGLRSDDAPTSL